MHRVCVRRVVARVGNGRCRGEPRQRASAYVCFDSSSPFTLAAERKAAARAILESAGDPQASTLEALEERRKQLQNEKKEIKRELHNENRRRKRMLSKAKSLPSEDLLSIVAIRAAAKAKSKAKAKAKSPGE